MERTMRNARLSGSLTLAPTLLALSLTMMAIPTETLAQAKIGARALKVPASKLLNTELQSLDKLKGRLILYEFFATW